MKKELVYKLFSDMPILETERLVLRPMRVSDAYDMYEYASRSDVTEYLLWSPHNSLFQTKEYLSYIEARYTAAEFYDWAVTLKDTGKMIGTAGFTRIDCTSDLGEIGYVLNPQYHGMGIAPEAAARVIEFGFDKLLLNRIEAKFMKGNEASLAVMKKLGMSFEGYLRDYMYVKGKYRTIGICSILKSEYNINKLN